MMIDRFDRFSILGLTLKGVIKELKVTRPSYFWRYHPNLKLSGIPTFTLIVSLTYSMDNI